MALLIFFSFSASFCSYLEVIVLYFRCSNCSQIFDSAHRNVYIYISVCYMYYLYIVHDMYHRYIMYGYPVYKILFMKIVCFFLNIFSHLFVFSPPPSFFFFNPKPELVLKLFLISNTKRDSCSYKRFSYEKRSVFLEIFYDFPFNSFSSFVPLCKMFKNYDFFNKHLIKLYTRRVW